MDKYAECIEYLHSLGLPMNCCKKICEKFKKKQDLEGLLNYVLIWEALVDSCVD